MPMTEDDLQRNELPAESAPPPLARRGAGARGGPAVPAAVPAAAVPRWVVRLLVVGLLAAALNLRPAISALGPLLKEVRADLGMSGAVAGLLTSVPGLCFAVFGSLAPRLARRRGPAPVVLGGMVAITSGLALRPLAGGTAVFLAASALALAGIAVSNVLMPVVVKRWFPGRIGSMTGLYSMGLALGTAGAAAVTVPMTSAMDGSWRAGLGSWALLGVLATVPWAVVLKDPATRRQARPAAERRGPGRRRGIPGTRPAPDRPLPCGGEVRGHRDVDRGPDVRVDGDDRSDSRGDDRIRIGTSRTAWALGGFFGLQASAAYIVLGWLPEIFRDAGVPASSAGLMLAVTMGMGVPLAFVVPRAAARMRHQGPLIVGLGMCGLTGYAGLWFAPGAGAWLWAVLLGIANCAFPVALTMISLRSRSSAGVAQLSAFAQSTGYLLSIPGPLLVGVLHDVSGGWHVPLILMTALLLAQTAVGVLAGRDRVIEDGR
ncbi:CynX/NimT family MFS transporter [Streptomyces ovatisporus]|uniref:CynX/NimT family MFS transporter n=1 Tax=Streptomyces ovatisporus TaxID=1128682 RepID=A0ABV9ABC7_9ACTN